MAMSLLPMEISSDKDLTVSFTVTSFMKSLGLEKGTKTRLLVQAAIEECAGSLIKILTPEDNYYCYTWFSKTILSHTSIGREIAWDWDRITMKFNKELAEALGDFKKQYAKFNLIDFGKLQSRYAIRIYELVMSYSGFAGKNGNKKNCWYIETMPIAQLRLLFDIEPNKYKMTKDFRVRVIDDPIEEINSANIGIRIEPEYVRQGKKLLGVKFNCRWVERDEPRNVTPVTETEKEKDKLIDNYPDEYKTFLDEELAQKNLFNISNEMFVKIAEAEAVKRLIEYDQKNKKELRKTHSKNKKLAS